MFKAVKSAILIFTFITLNISLIAQDTQKYTLDDVIKIAREQSPDALIAKHRFRSAYWSFRSFKAQYLPGVELNASMPNINRSINAVQGQDGSSVYTAQSFTDYSVDLSINQRIGFTGGNLFVSSGIRRMDNFLTDTSTTSYLTNMINIGINQPIFKYNAFKWDKIIEPIKYDEARRTYIETNEQVATTALQYFFNLLLAQIELNIAKKNESNYDTLYRIAKGRYELGKIAENELLQLELNLLRSQASVEQSELDYENRLFTFKSYLRIKSKDPIELIPPVDIKHFDVNIALATEQAKENTSDGLSFQRRILEAESELNKAKREGRFNADLYAMFGLTQSSDNVPDAYKNPLDEERVSLGINIPILDWGRAKGMRKMAESNLDLVQTSVEQDKIDFEQNIFIEVMQFNMQEKQLFIAAKSDTVAQKRFDVTQKRYMIGKVNDVLELNNAQIDNDNAKKGYFAALMTYWRSYYTLRKLTLYDFEKNRPIIINTDEVLK